MSEVIRRAAFLSDVTPGMRFQLTVSDEPPWLVTDRRDVEGWDILVGKPRITIVLIGQDDNGEPKSQMGAPWVTVVIHETVPSEAQP